VATGGVGWARTLRSLEVRLRARGLTGSEAFDLLLPALEARAGGAATGVDEELFAVVSAVPQVAGDDLLGLAYEHFLSDVYKGERGQYFTPPPLCRLLWSRLPLQPGEVVLDPTCGSGGLLLPVASVGAELRGFDLDGRLARLAKVNLRLLGVDADIRRLDFFREPPEPVDVVVANPPFSVALDDPDLALAHRGLAGPRGVSSDVVFLSALRGWVRPGGRAGVVVPWSVVANPSLGRLRAHVLDAFEVEAVVALPEGVFRPFGGATGRAGVLWLRRRGGPGPAVGTWYRSVRDPGWDVRSRRFRPTSGAELEAAVRGEGFVHLPGVGFAPVAARAEGVRLDELATVVSERGRAAAGVDLGDVDGLSGELVPREVVRTRRLPLVRPGDVVFSRLRPELGIVGIHGGAAVVSGSAEWIVLRPAAHARWLRHALRTPVFRRDLPLTGQTRPRTTLEAVRSAWVPAPRPEVRAAVDEASAALAAWHRIARAGLEALQAAVDAHAAGAIDDDALLERTRAVLPSAPKDPTAR
jgi:hypothetical protein